MTRQTESARPAVLAGVPLSAAYQPIVDLTTGNVVAFEALARGPFGTPLAMPAAIYATARTPRELHWLDWACRAAAMEGALAGGLQPPLCLFLNAEPEALSSPCPPEFAETIERGRAALRPVLEITERALTADPAGLMAAIDDARQAGWGIALDDVGAHPASLALMPFLDPDVIKLDLSLIQERTDAETAAIANAVFAQCERSRAVILAEGIETEEHRQRALALGATLGQGWLLGPPSQLPEQIEGAPVPVRPRVPPIFDPGTPFSIVAHRLELRVATKDLLLPLSHHLEREALRATEPPVLLAAFEDAVHFTPATRRRYADLARRCAFVGALGAGLDAAPTWGVRGASLDAHDRLRGEWVVTCVGPHFAGALIARDLGDDGPDWERRFEFAMTYDRETVLRVARTLLGRIVAS